MKVPDGLRSYAHMDLRGYERNEVVQLIISLGEFDLINIIDEEFWKGFYRQLIDYLPIYIRENTVYGS